MKPGASTLNPYAASYIPLSARSTTMSTTVEVPKLVPEEPRNYADSHSAAAYFGAAAAADNRNHANSFRNANSPKNYPATFGSPSSQYPNAVDDEFEMDLEYLSMQFPGLSVQSLADVYMANSGDLDGTLDMLSQLEYDNLPETLDIGDISESGSSKLKNVVGEASTSSSSPSKKPTMVIRRGVWNVCLLYSLSSACFNNLTELIENYLWLESIPFMADQVDGRKFEYLEFQDFLRSEEQLVSREIEKILEHPQV
ncbi:hypothetical protein ACFE04_017033 [Oxalis oulophora]